MLTVRSVGPKGVEFRVVVRDDSGSDQHAHPGRVARHLPGRQSIALPGWQHADARGLRSARPSLSNPRTVIDGVNVTTIGATWAVAGDTIVYGLSCRPAAVSWVDRSGRITPSRPRPATFRVQHLAIGRPGRRDNPRTERHERRLDPGPAAANAGATDDGCGQFFWRVDPDGTEILMTRLNGADRDVLLQRADGSAPARLVLHTGEQTFATAIEPRLAHDRSDDA